MVKVYDTKCATVIVHPIKGIVQHKFHQFIYGEEFRNALLAGSDAFIKHNCTKWLSDDRDNLALKQEDIEWDRMNWEKDLFNAGWNHWALVMPEKLNGKLTVKKVVDYYALKGINVGTFTTPDKAMKWLEKQ